MSHCLDILEEWMRTDNADVLISPSDLSSFLGCRHKTALELAAVRSWRNTALITSGSMSND